MQIVKFVKIGWLQLEDLNDLIYTPRVVTFQALMSQVSETLKRQWCRVLVGSLVALVSCGREISFQSLGPHQSQPIPASSTRLPAGLVEVNVSHESPLADQISLWGLEWVAVPEDGQLNDRNYVVPLADAFADIDIKTDPVLAEYPGATLVVTEKTSELQLIYLDDFPVVTFDDVVLASALSTLPDDLRTPHTLANVANILYPSRSQPYRPADLDPFPNAINTNYVTIRGVTDPDIYDVAALYIAFLLPDSLRTRDLLALGINLVLGSSITAADIAVIPGEQIPAPASEIRVVLEGLEIVDGQRVDLGSILVGQPFTRRLTIENTGIRNLVLRNLRLPNSFTLTPSIPLLQGISIAPGTSEIFDLTVTAPQLGPITGEIRFNTNDTNENPFNLRVTANAVSVPQLSVPDVIVGELTSNDPLEPLAFPLTVFSDTYALVDTQPGEFIQVNLVSNAYTPVLLLIDRSSGDPITLIQGVPEAQLIFQVEAGVDYIIRAASQLEQQTGDYRLSTQRTSPLTFNFRQDGFEDDAFVEGSFTAVDLDSDGQLVSFFGEILAFEATFSGNSLVPATALNINDLLGLVYDLDGGNLGDGINGEVEGIGAGLYTAGPGLLALCDGVNVCGTVGPSSSTQIVVVTPHTVPRSLARSLSHHSLSSYPFDWNSLSQPLLSWP